MIDWTKQSLMFKFVAFDGTKITTDTVTITIDENEYYQLSQER